MASHDPVPHRAGRQSAGLRARPSAGRVARLAWAAPTTLIGQLAALPLWLLGIRGLGVDDVLEPCAQHPGPWLRALRRHLPFEAITLGHVVLAVDARAMRRWRAHEPRPAARRGELPLGGTGPEAQGCTSERVHVRQAERWGPLFPPLYLAASAWCWLHGRDAYRDNPFEREAFGRNDVPGRHRT